MENKKELKVLVVEDDRFLRDICVNKLGKRGIDVIAASDGERALEILEKEPVSVVLLDLILPAIDGFEVLKRIRENTREKIKNTPVIILSNLGQDSDVEKAMALGANDFLIKAHFTTSEIVERIKKIIS